MILRQLPLPDNLGTGAGDKSDKWLTVVPGLVRMRDMGRAGFYRS